MPRLNLFSEIHFHEDFTLFFVLLSLALQTICFQSFYTTPMLEVELFTYTEMNMCDNQDFIVRIKTDCSGFFYELSARFLLSLWYFWSNGMFSTVSNIFHDFKESLPVDENVCLMRNSYMTEIKITIIVYWYTWQISLLEYGSNIWPS